MNNDIVARLERLMCSEAGCGDMRIYMTAKLAAAEIQLLREENRELSGKTGELKREECAACAIDLKETQRERDEARREVCEWMSLQTERQPRVIAQNRGWDCFKKEEATDD